MSYKSVNFALILIFIVQTVGINTPQIKIDFNNHKSKYTVQKVEDDGKSSLVFVFDTTGSMYNDLRQLREGAEMILKTALEEGDVIGDFVFVPFHDPVVGPATVTTSKRVLKSALNIVRVYGGGDCPEKSLTGINLALNVSRPHSYIYVFTDATAADYRLVGKVLDAVQRKQSQVVFVLTGHCNDLHRPSYKVYQQIAAASSGQVFNLNKTSVHKVLDFVRSSIKGKNVNLGSVIQPAKKNFTQNIPVDSTLAEVTVSVSGAKPKIKVVNPSGELLTGPPKLITTLDLSEIMVVKVMQPEPGNWSITVGSEESYSVKVVGLSNLTFNHGFSVEKPEKVEETSYRPMKGTYNHMLISLTQTDAPVDIICAEITNLNGKTLFEVPLRKFNDKQIYIADAFVPPDDFFYIAIRGHDQFNQELRRIGATAVQAKVPDVPYITASRAMDARFHERVVLKCYVESLVPVTAVWMKDGRKVGLEKSSLQSTSIDYEIEDMTEEHGGTYNCFAKNVAGNNKALTELTLIVDPPQVTISPENKTVLIGEDVIISCTVFTEVLLEKFNLVYNGTSHKYYKIHLEPSINGIYRFNKTIKHMTKNTEGMYSCVAANRGGQSSHSTYITIQSPPTAQILGPHTITKLMHTDLQIVCNVDNADTMQWIAPNHTVVSEIQLNGTFNAVLNVKNITQDGVWKCVAVMNDQRAIDTLQLNITMKPIATIAGETNVTIVNGTSVNITCVVVAKPKPRIIWHRETEDFLNHTITFEEPNKYISVLTLNSSLEAVAATYFCYGENAEGIAHDNATVNVRRKMILVEGFKDQSAQLYSQVEFHCNIDTYPQATITWQHNGTIISTKENVYLREGNTTLSISNVGFEDLGLYSCEASNGYEKLSLNGTLSIWGLEYPTIAKERDTVVARRGHSTIITCRISQGNPEPTITWQYRNDSSLKYGELPYNVQSNDDRIELMISNITIGNIGTYRCIAENVLGSDVFDTALIVQYPPHLKQPREELKEHEPIEVEAGHTITLSCEADGMPLPLVVWYKDQRPVVFSKNVYLTDANDLILKEVTPYDSGVFTCNASSVLGSTQRNFTLIVYVPPNLTSPEIEPDLEVLEGQLVEMPCSGRGVPKPEFTWLQNGEPIVERRKYIDDDGIRFVANLTDFGEYKCIVKNKYGTKSISFMLYIWVSPSIEPPLHITENVVSGHNVTLECNVIGFPIPNILWEFGDQILMENTTNLSFNEYGSLFVNNASSKQDGVYACVAENLAGVTRKFIRLNVNEPPVILADNYPGPYIATNMDTTLLIACNVAGKPKPYVVWTKDDYYLDNDDRYSIDDDATLTIKSPSEDLSGLYTCIAKNTVGEVNRTVSVEIYSLPTQVQAEESTNKMVTLLEGANATVDCPVSHTSKDLVKWYKDAQVVSRGQLHFPNVSRHEAATYACVVTTAVASAYASVTVGVEWPPAIIDNGGREAEVVRGDDWYFDCGVDAKPAAKTKWLFNSRPLLFEDKPRLRLLSVQLRHTGTYKCIVSNKHGTLTKQFTLDVLEPPFISEFDLLDVQLKAGSNATLECEARGSPTPDITWTFNNTNWNLENSTLIASNISPQSEGLYRCDAANKAGKTHIVYRVSVVSGARIVEVVAFNGSVGVTVGDVTELVLGSRVRISCRASGSPIPTIQWIRNGQVLGENDHDISYVDLTLEDVQPSYAGAYSCIATNDGGVDGRKIRVEVLEPPKIFQMLFQNQNYSENPINIEVISGQAFYLHCHPYGNPMPEVYWFKNDLPLRLFDDTMVSTDYGEVIVAKNAIYEQSGNYTCVARNKVGNTSVVYLVDVLIPPPIPKESSKQINTRVGKQLNLTCPVEGSPQPYVMWIKHPYTEIGEHTPRLGLLNDNFTLIFNSTEVADSGKYSCIMTNKVGTTEVVFDVTVEKPPSIAGNIGKHYAEKHVVPLRRSVVLKCEADGHPLPKITWLKDTQQLSNSLSNIQRVLGNSLLAIWSASVRDAGQYICVVENSAGTAHRRYNVLVQVPGKWSSWSQWSFCNVTCGLGYQHRTRVCHYVDDDNVTLDKTSKPDKVVLDESACRGLGTDRRKCHMPSCEEELPPRWSGWSKWSTCTSSCGAGTQTRTRRCRSKTPCYGDNVQIRKCPNLPKCDSISNSDENEVYSSQEENNATTYNPEETYEFQPAVVNAPYSSDVEEFRVLDKTYKEYGYPNIAALYYDVNVTENLDRSDRGPCDPGFRHNTTSNSCDDIDECLIEANQCHATQVCVNTLGAYRCTCGHGYRALGAGLRCLDVNECLQDIHGCEFACVNVAGGYVCACPRRLRLHADRRHCVEPALYREPIPFDHIETATEEYLSTSVDYPVRYTKSGSIIC